MKTENRKASILRYVHSEKGKAANARSQKSEKGKAAMKRHRKSEKGKTSSARSNARYQKSEKGKAAMKRYRKSEKCKTSNARYRKSERGKAVARRQDGKITVKLSKSLYSMVRGTHDGPTTFPRLGIFASNEEATAHIESTFEPWMNSTNTGVHRIGDAYRSKWHIGHRIPKCWYDHEDLEEVKKAWSRANLFAQCARENLEARNRNILTALQWDALKPIWPKQCDGLTDIEAWEWCRTNQALNDSSETQAGPSDLNDLADSGTDSESDVSESDDGSDSDSASVLMYGSDSDSD